MPLSYEIDTERGIVRITAVGAPSLEEQAKLAEGWMADSAYRKGMSILLDNRLRTTPSSRAHVKNVADHTGAAKGLEPGTRCAVVVASDAEFGMTRMFASMSERRPLLTRPFRDVASAEEWLASEES